MRVRIPHLGKQLLFAVLSGTDLVLTWWLIGNTDGQLYEANPIASWWLTRFGWIGLVCFKALIVLVVLGLSAVIHYSRPRAAGRLLRLACASLTVVVLYSTGLCLAAHFAPWKSDGEKELAALNADTGRVFQQREAFVNLLAILREDLLAGAAALSEKPPMAWQPRMPPLSDPIPPSTRIDLSRSPLPLSSSRMSSTCRSQIPSGPGKSPFA